MNISPDYIRPGNDGWDPLNSEYYKQYSTLITNPELRARAEEQMQRIVRQAEEVRKTRELQRHQEMVKAQEASRQQSRPPMHQDYQEQLRLLGEQDKMRRSKRQVAMQEQSILQQQQMGARERQKRVAEEEHMILLRIRNEEREKKRREADEERKIIFQRQNEEYEIKRLQLEREGNIRLVQESIDRETRRAADEQLVRVARPRMEEERRTAEQEEAARNHRQMAARAKREQAEMERRQQDLKARASETRLAPASQNRNMHLLGRLRAVQANSINQDQQKLHARHKDIVSAAIEAVMNQATSGQKRSHAEFQEGTKPAAVAPQIHKKPETVFSRMMRAPQKVTDCPHDFNHWDTHLQQALDDQVSSGYVRSEADWAATVTDTIKTSLESMILPYTRHRAHPQTKINALHVLIEIATATAYAPRSTAADMIRQGSLPKILLSDMLEIAERMSGSERNTVLEEQAFLSKVKTLRYQPMIPWEGNTWTALDEVLRLIRDPGPVGFRMIFDQLSSQIQSGRGVISIATGVRRTIKSDITSYVTPSTCFESKYNAMNVLADAGLLAMKEFGASYRNSADVLVEVAVALSDLGRILDGDEVRRIHAEMAQEASFSPKNFLDDFLESIDDDILAFKARDDRQFKRDYNFKLNICAQIRDFVEKKEWQNKRTHGNDGLLAKFLLLRWNNNAYDPGWFKCRDALDDLLEMLVDGSVPLACDRYLWKVDSVLHNAAIQGSNIYTREKAVKEARVGVDRNIGHVLALARKGCLETKINTFKTLAKIGMKMIEWMSPGPLRWQVEVFKDHLSEDAVTDAMMVICDSMVKMGGLQALSSQEFRIVNDLDVSRAPIPEAFEGLDGVLGVIKDPSKMGSRHEKRVKSLTVLKSKTVIDLTED